MTGQTNVWYVMDVDRLAAIDAPAFPLQILLKEHPEWGGWPAAVVAEDKPQAALLWVNEKAWRAGARPGQRYAAALSLARELRAGVIAPDLVEREVAKLTDRLRRFTPGVEPANGEPGVFWLDASGLDRLHPSLSRWADAISADLAHAGFRASVVVGFTRFGTYAVARSSRGPTVFGTPAEESSSARRVLLARLGIEPAVREALGKLGVRTVAEFLRLPAGGLLPRFGPEAHRLHRLAAGDLWTPLQPRAPEEPRQRHEELLSPDADAERLLFLVKRLLDSLLVELAGRGEAIAELQLHLKLDDKSERAESVRPAAPTLDSAQLLGLVRLRLETVRLAAGVVDVVVVAGGVPASREQLRLFIEAPRRDLRAASRAFARLRAELGDGAVVQARLREAHLPRARFSWEPLEKATAPGPRTVAVRPLVRRIYERAQALPPRPRSEPDGWLLRGLDHGPAAGFRGPYVVSGGWWRGGAHREYYFAQMKSGDVLWVYFDRPKQRWYLEGRVE